MKDSFFLILTAACFSFAAWLFWHFLGKDAFDVFTTLVLLILLADNIRLRREMNYPAAATGYHVSNCFLSSQQAAGNYTRRD